MRTDVPLGDGGRAVIETQPASGVVGLSYVDATGWDARIAQELTPIVALDVAGETLAAAKTLHDIPRLRIAEALIAAAIIAGEDRSSWDQ